MERCEYRTFRFSLKAAEDLASYDRFGAEGWELAGLTGITTGSILTYIKGTSWALAVFKRRIAVVASARGLQGE